MEWLGIILGLLVFVGLAVTILERRRGRDYFVDERPSGTPQSETDREAIRAADAATQGHTDPPGH